MVNGLVQVIYILFNFIKIFDMKTYITHSLETKTWYKVRLADTKEMIEILADHLQKIEEKMDLLITLTKEEPSKKKAKVDAKTPLQKSYPHGLFVGDLFAGGRCGGLGRCSFC